MGNIVGRVRYRMTRPIREYNLEDRAIKAVSRNKAIPSPRHPSTDSLIEKAIKNLTPEIKDQLENPNPNLHSHLRQVFVTSKDITPVQPVSRSNPERPLPLSRSRVQPAQYGYHEPKAVPYGKVILKDVLQFLTKHRENPEEHNAAQIATTYKLDEQLTGQVLKHFGVFRMVVPAERTEKQAEMMTRLQATSDHMPNTAQLQRTLQGVPVLGMPAMGDKKGKLPLTQIREPEVDRYHDVTMIDFKLKDPLARGRQEGDPFLGNEPPATTTSQTNDKEAEVIEGVPLQSARQPENIPQSNAQKASDKEEEIIERVPVRSARRPEDIPQSKAQKAGRR